MMFSGISDARISRHLKRVENDFYSFKSKQDYINNRLIQIQENTVRVIDHDMKLFAINYNRLECLSSQLLEYTATTFCIKDWEEK